MRYRLLVIALFGLLGCLAMWPSAAMALDPLRAVTVRSYFGFQLTPSYPTTIPSGVQIISVNSNPIILESEIVRTIDPKGGNLALHRLWTTCPKSPLNLIITLTTTLPCSTIRFVNDSPDRTVSFLNVNSR